MIREWVICLSHAWGGLEQVVLQDVIDHLDSCKIQVDLLVLAGSPLESKARSVPGLRLHVLKSAPSNVLSWELRKWIGLACKGKAQILHLHQPSLLGSVVPWLALISKSRRPALVVSRHIQSNHLKKSPYHRWLYSKVDAVVVMSQALAKNVRETHPPVRIECVRLGLDFDRFKKTPVSGKKLRQEWGCDSGTTVIGCVGRIDPSKGQLEFVQAALDVLDRAQKPLKFIIVGESTRGMEPVYEQRVRALIQESKHRDAFIWAGYLRDIPEVMAALDLLAMPSLAEAFGLVAIEAMAMGCVEEVVKKSWVIHLLAWQFVKKMQPH